MTSQERTDLTESSLSAVRCFQPFDSPLPRRFEVILLELNIAARWSSHGSMRAGTTCLSAQQGRGKPLQRKSRPILLGANRQPAPVHRATCTGASSPSTAELDRGGRGRSGEVDDGHERWTTVSALEGEGGVGEGGEEGTTLLRRKLCGRESRESQLCEGKESERDRDSPSLNMTARLHAFELIKSSSTGGQWRTTDLQVCSSPTLGSLVPRPAPCSTN